ncbi:MAG: hypothetical protein HYX35_06155 [Proteobacteria bacterium]|nr:hypothetical protein [Pseudomonadota bacterium]
MKKLLLSLTLGASVILVGGGSDLFAQMHIGQKASQVFQSQESCEVVKGAGNCTSIIGAEAQAVGCPSDKCFR